MLLDALQPVERRSTVGVHIDQHVAGCRTPAGFTGQDKPLARFVHDPDAGNAARELGRSMGTGIVDDEDFVGTASLREQGVEACFNVPFFVECTDNDAAYERHRLAPCPGCDRASARDLAMTEV